MSAMLRSLTPGCDGHIAKTRQPQGREPTSWRRFGRAASSCQQSGAASSHHYKLLWSFGTAQLPRSSVLNPGRASTNTSRRLAKIFQRSPCCWESDGNLGNILPICRLRNSAQSFRTPSEDFATLTISACGLSLTDSQWLASPFADPSTQARDVSAP